MVSLAVPPDFLSVEELNDGPGSGPLGGFRGEPLATIGVSAGSSPGFHLEERLELLAVDSARRGDSLLVGHEMEDFVLRLEIPREAAGDDTVFEMRDEFVPRIALRLLGGGG